MSKLILLTFFALTVLSSVHLLPTTDHVKPNTPENIERLKNLRHDELAYLYSGQTEGDMVLPPEHFKSLYNKKNGKTVLIDEQYRWTNNIVPYLINEEDFTTAQINYITLGVQKIMDVSCIKFVPYNPEIHNNYVYVTGQNSGCWSYVGMLGGRQQLNLQSFDVETGCFRLYTIVHEFMHALGFYHMQSATERDEYVKIIWENIQEGMAYNFDKHGTDVVSQYGIDYDYGSVMHYPPTAFSINQEPTIIALKDTRGEVMGQQVRISAKDIARLNAKYCTNRRPRNIFELFELMNKRMNDLFNKIFMK